MPDTNRILIVDDTSENLAILGELLSGYRRNFALNGIDALAQLHAGDPPDLILLDVMMPGMDGFEVCHRLKSDAKLREIPVIFITAMDDSAAETKGFALGAVDYITKPFNAAVVKARVKTHLDLKAAKESLAQQNQILETQVAARTVELKDALEQVTHGSLETIHRLAHAAEFKDKCTGEHVVRMSQYSAVVADRMGLGGKEVELLLHAAPMHDIGKIGIPDRVLLKPGKLDPDELKIMQEHAAIGARILSGSDSPIIKLAEEIALSHHERWDGGGYPNKLKGTDIPLAARIAAIADVFDALTTLRPYKRAFDISEALELISNERGCHFDPTVTDSFLGVVDKILQIKSRLADAQPSLPRD